MSAKNKKPVWVDEEAHSILKAYAKLNGRSMLDMASELVLTRLADLDPEEGLTAPTADSPDPVSDEMLIGADEVGALVRDDEKAEASDAGAAAPRPAKPAAAAPAKDTAADTSARAASPASKAKATRGKKRSDEKESEKRHIGGVWLV